MARPRYSCHCTDATRPAAHSFMLQQVAALCPGDGRPQSPPGRAPLQAQAPRSALRSAQASAVAQLYCYALVCGRLLSLRESTAGRRAEQGRRQPALVAYSRVLGLVGDGWPVVAAQLRVFERESCVCACVVLAEDTLMFACVGHRRRLAAPHSWARIRNADAWGAPAQLRRQGQLRHGADAWAGLTRRP